MPKRAKRAKAKLRKSGTADDINEFNAAQAFEARTGGDLAQVPDDALFTMDAEPDHIAAAGQSTRASRKAAARVRLMMQIQAFVVRVRIIVLKDAGFHFYWLSCAPSRFASWETAKRRTSPDTSYVAHDLSNADFFCVQIQFQFSCSFTQIISTGMIEWGDETETQLHL